MSLASIIGGFVRVPKAGLSTAQVQALIDAALAGKGVIGTAVLTITSDTVAVTYADGILTETTGATYEYADAQGRLTVTLTQSQPDAFYQPSLTVMGGGTPLSAKLRTSIDPSLFQFDIARSDDAPAAGGADITAARVTVSRRSQ